MFALLAGTPVGPGTSEQMQKAKAAGGEVIHLPLVLGGVVPAYKLDQVKEPLRLTGPVLADIFLGKITQWNDPAIKELNAGVDLPDQKIVVLHRSDASGSTAIFTDAGGEVIHLPLVLGGVVPAYKLDQVKEPLRLTGWELHWKGRGLEG